MNAAASVFVACRKLEDNFLKIPNPNSKSRLNYQKCLLCNFEFGGATAARKAHVTGLNINGTRVKQCIKTPNAALVLEIKAELAKEKVDKIADSQREALLGL